MEVASLRKLRTCTFLLILYVMATARASILRYNAFERTPAVSTFDQYVLYLSLDRLHFTGTKKDFLGSMGLMNHVLPFVKKKKKKKQFNCREGSTSNSIREFSLDRCRTNTR